MSDASSASGRFLVGLDLGQSMDPTALAVVERTGEYPAWQHGVRLLRRWPPGAKYPEIVRDVGTMVDSPPLKGGRLVVDYSGVGRPVVDQLAVARLPVELFPMTITAGHAFSRDVDGLHVAKVRLIGTLQVLLQSQRLKIANCPERETLLRELADYRVKVTPAANEVFDAREGKHDDLLLATAMACWIGETMPEQYTGPLCLWPEPPPEPGTPEFAERQRQYDKDNGIVTILGHRIALEDPAEDRPWGC